MYIDSHTHFDLTLENRDITEEEIFSELEENSVMAAVQISIGLEGLAWSFEFAKKHRAQGVLFSAGIHPSSPADEQNLQGLRDFVSATAHSIDSDLLFGIGECGLDYFRMRQPEKEQIASFEYQIGLAQEFGLPVIVHSREAMEDTLSIVRRTAPERVIMHCFPGGKEDARKALDLGCIISFAGNVTYKSASALHESAAFVPRDRLLVETDAPFLTPVPLRGKKNRSHYITHTYAFLAELRKEPLSTLTESVRENFKRLKAQHHE